LAESPERSSGGLVVHRFEIDQTYAQGIRQFQPRLTPKAFANFSPGLERSDNPGSEHQLLLNPERVRQPANPFRVESHLESCPRVLAMLEPWARISERLRRICINSNDTLPLARTLTRSGNLLLAGFRVLKRQRDGAKSAHSSYRKEHADDSIRSYAPGWRAGK
jgi:hypothetical protein